MKKEHELALIEQSKKISVKEAATWSIMDGFGARYITPYALALGASNTQIGILSSIPSLIGNFSQLYTLREMNKYSRKKLVFIGVALQAIMWLFLIAIGIIPFVLNIKTNLSPNLLLIVYTLLTLFGAFAGPAWTSWMKDLVTENRGEYFGKRSRIASAVSLTCMLLASFILDYFKQTKIFIGFIIIFFIAFVGRSISAYLTLKQYEPKFKADKKAYFTLFEFLKKARYNNFGVYTIYTTLINFSVCIASPFFAVYMLKNLNFSYMSYILVTLSAVVTSFIFMPFWGKFADKYGNVLTMRVNGIFIAFMPLLWLFSVLVYQYYPSQILIYLLIIEAFSGIIWAGFNLAAGNFIYDAVTRQRMAICTTYNNITTSLGIVIGSLLGGWIASLNFTFLGLTPLLFIFALSAVARLLVYLIMDPRIREVRPVKNITLKQAEIKMREKLSIYKFFEHANLNFLKVKPA